MTEPIIGVVSEHLHKRRGWRVAMWFKLRFLCSRLTLPSSIVNVKQDSRIKTGHCFENLIINETLNRICPLRRIRWIHV